MKLIYRGSVLCLLGVVLVAQIGLRGGINAETPEYLQSYEALYQKDPKQAAIAWFEEAGFGLFIHFGLYAILGRGEWGHAARKKYL